MRSREREKNEITIHSFLLSFFLFFSRKFLIMCQLYKILISFSFFSLISLLIFLFVGILAELYTLRPLFPGSSEADEIYKICSILG